jgi:hypothetical protein
MAAHRCHSRSRGSCWLFTTVGYSRVGGFIRLGRDVRSGSSVSRSSSLATLRPLTRSLRGPLANTGPGDGASPGVPSYPCGRELASSLRRPESGVPGSYGAEDAKGEMDGDCGGDGRGLRHRLCMAMVLARYVRTRCMEVRRAEPNMRQQPAVANGRRSLEPRPSPAGNDARRRPTTPRPTGEHRSWGEGWRASLGHLVHVP